MSNIVKTKKLDICIFIFQIVLGGLSIILGGVNNKEMFIAMGVAVWCGGIASLMTLLKSAKQYNEDTSELFDERADFIEGNAATIAFKMTVVCLEVVFVFSFIFKSENGNIFSLLVGGVLFIILIIYILMYNWYDKRY